ncbi:zona pellucida sperm-binding protein 3-like [Hyperolius riggenbachi]|uniref:zona pellucida sperm-binding protein 3-like n=1 Tax=Hyperolius riggenbachi TaxID=752182 RepID=UPI0035A33B47
MVVSVSRNFYGNGKLVKPSDLTLGPQSCQPTSQTADTVVFQNTLQDCSNPVQMTADLLIYSTSLLYNPTSDVPIIRTNSAVVPITCFYFRHDNVSSNAIRPTWSPFSTTISTEEKLSFNLQLMTDNWSGPRNSIVYQLGDAFNIEASVQTENHIGLILFVDSCVATQSPDPTSKPSYDIISANGRRSKAAAILEVESMRPVRWGQAKPWGNGKACTDGGTERETRRTSSMDSANKKVYITCNLTAAPATQVPDSMNKACSFNKATNSWSPVEGSNNICRAL